jgi:hypothetical protein
MRMSVKVILPCENPCKENLYLDIVRTWAISGTVESFTTPANAVSITTETAAILLMHIRTQAELALGFLELTGVSHTIGVVMQH